MSSDLGRLRVLLGGPGSTWLLERVRERLSRGHAGPLAGSVQLRAPSPDQRMAAMRLVGTPRRAGHTLRVDLGEVESVLRRGIWPAGLADAVVALTGPVVVRSRERAVEAAAWARAASAFGPAVEVRPELGPWWDRWCATGNLKRAARAELARIGGPTSAGECSGDVPGDVDAVEARADGPADVASGLAEQAARCLCALPTTGEPLAVFARRTTGDAHGLDPSRPLGRIVVAALGALAAGAPWAAAEVDGAGQPTPDDHLGPATDDALGTRELWAGVGVLISSLASTVLCLGVPAAEPSPGGGSHSVGGTAVATVLEACRSARTPVVLTLDQVRSGGVGVLPPDAVVHVCENPSVVEMLGRQWPGSTSGVAPVLVCTSGQPGAAVLELLEHLVSAGASVRYHGDFDWAGLRIATSLAARVPWRPWRFCAADYEEAVTVAVSTGRGSLALRGAATAAPWDPSLAAAMTAHGVAIEEEEVVDHLVGDLLDR